MIQGPLAIGIALLVMAPAGYVLSPSLLDLVNAAPAVQAQALPFLRIMFMTSSGMLIYFMVAGALRSAGDARTPMILGIVLTVLNLVFNIIFISGFARADTLTIAMNTRSYRGGRYRTKLRQMRASPSDWLALALVTLWILVAWMV